LGGGKKGKKKKKVAKDKDAAPAKKKVKEPPVEFEPWSNFLEELCRKAGTGAVKMDDFVMYAGYLAPAEVRGLNAVCATIGKSTFPDNFDDKLAVLRELVVTAAAAAAHRKPGEWLMPSAASGKTVEVMVKEGATAQELRRCGFRPDEVVAAKAGAYTRPRFSSTSAVFVTKTP